MESATTENPIFTLENTTNDTTSAHLKLLKEKGAAGAFETQSLGLPPCTNA